MSRKSVLVALIILGTFNTAACYHLPTAKGVDIVWKEGHITTDETWFYIPNTVYSVIGDVYVDPGVTLTIEPGVTVQFTDNFSLIVNGTLYAVGTTDKPINFTSSRPDPSPGIWNAIKFIGGKNESFTVKYSVVTYAKNGITIATEDGYALIEKCEIRNNSESGIMIVGKSNVIVKGSTIKYNGKGIGTDDSSTHSGIIIVNNTISFNQDVGICVYSREYGGYGGDGYGYICNVTISSNTASFNSGDGINLHGYGSGVNGSYCGYGYIHSVAVSSNTVCSNSGDGLYVVASQHHAQVTYDLAVWKNTISANYQKGIEIEGEINANLTCNSISYNKYGVFYTATKDNMAEYNDIYQNSYGMNVSNGAAVSAKNNYWGDAKGPHHQLLNPEGKGNPVDGDGTNLVFIPFLVFPTGTINQRPVAILYVGKTKIYVNETVTFDATKSTDDGRIDYYFFDFGDGTNSGWITNSSWEHKYTKEGKYNATLIAMDDFGVTSLDSGLVCEPIAVIPESPSFLLLPLFVIATLFIIATLLAVIAYKRKRTASGKG